MDSTKTATFLERRPRLFGIAYRMLGARHEAEDAVQEAYLRWHQSDESTLRSADAWLVSLTTRVCIDRLRALKVEREAYLGPWLPEPLLTQDVDSPERQLELAGDVSIAFLTLLERLSPEERAAFLLREVFEFDYAEIASALDRGEGACRQMVYRAKARLKSGQPRFEVSEKQHRALIERFVAASTAGDMNRLAALLAEDARLTADGGGKVVVVTRPLLGAQRIARLFHVTARWVDEHSAVLGYRSVRINGQPGLLRLFNDKPHSVLAFDTDGTKIRSIFVLANPDKLEGLDALLHADSSRESVAGRT